MASTFGSVDHCFPVSPDLPYEVILGSDILSVLGATLLFRERMLRLLGQLIQLEPAESCLLTIKEGDGEQDEWEDMEEEEADVKIETATLSPKLTQQEKKPIRDLLTTYLSVFREAIGSKPCDFPAFHVDTGDAPPIASRPYRIPYSERDLIEKEIKEYLRRGWIRPSKSVRVSPTLLVMQVAITSHHRRLVTTALLAYCATSTQRDNMDQSQEGDTYCNQKRATMEQTSSFAIKDGILVVKVPGTDRTRIIVPSEMRHNVLKMVHSESMSGHPGIRRACSRVAMAWSLPK
jgi:hypothetical protein